MRSIAPSAMPLPQPAVSLLRFALLGLVSLTTACSGLSQPAPPAEASPAATTPAATAVVALGRLTPKGEVIKISVVNAQDSRVNQILVQEGDRVKENQVIAILQGRDRVEQQVRDAEANVAIKRAQLLKTQQGDAKAAEITAQQASIAELEGRLQTEIAEREATIAEAQATLSNAETNYQRYVLLAQEGAVQQAELDNVRTEYERAQATLARNQAELANSRSSLQAQLDRERATLAQLREVRPVDIEIAQAELDQALIQLEQRRAELADTEVRVPVSGQILRINTRVGEQVNTEEGIAELGQTDQMYAVAEVYETQIGKIRKGQQVTIASEYGGFEGEVKGVVDQIGLQVGTRQLSENSSDPTQDENTRVVEVKIRVDANDSSKVASLTNMQVRVTIDTDSPVQPSP